MKAIKICSYRGETDYKLGEYRVHVYKYRSGNRYDGWKMITMHSYVKEGKVEIRVGGIRVAEENFNAGKF